MKRPAVLAPLAAAGLAVGLGGAMALGIVLLEGLDEALVVGAAALLAVACVALAVVRDY